MTRLRLFKSLVRSLAVASLAAAALAGGSAGPAAQTSPGQKPPAVAAATSTRPETVEQRVAALKTALKITPELEAKWNAVAQAMRENASRMEKLVAARRATSPDKMTAVDSLKAYQELAEARLAGLKHLTSSFEALYDSMTSEQRVNADEVFEQRVPSRAGPQG